MSNFVLRSATPADSAAIHSCITAAYAHYVETIPDLPDVASGIDEDIDRNIVTVAVRDSILMGVLIMTLSGDHLHLANVAVHPGAKGQGLGRCLIKSAEALAKEMGFRQLHLTTHRDMPGNVSLYEHLGWTVSSQSGTKVRMSRNLDD